MLLLLSGKETPLINTIALMQAAKGMEDFKITYL